MSLLDQVFGYVGSILLIISFIPQVYKSYTTKCLEDIPYLFLIFLSITYIVLLNYIIFIKKPLLIIGFGGGLIQILLLMLLKYKYRYRTKNIKHNIQRVANTHNLSDISEERLNKIPYNNSFKFNDVFNSNSTRSRSSSNRTSPTNSQKSHESYINELMMESSL